LKEWRIVEGSDYNKSLARVPQVIREEIEKNVIPILEEYPYPVKDEKTIKHLEGKWKGFYEFKLDQFKIGSYRLIFRPNVNSKKILLVWVKVKPFAY
jgi:mRNA-degrading endonuclease RelE of RelBE toxin-antitoxin system